MKTKNLLMTAIICGASIFGFNFSTAQAATNFEITNIDQNIKIEQLSHHKKDPASSHSMRLRKIIDEMERDNNKNHRHHEDYHDRGHHHYPPPPPPPAHHQHRR